MRNPKNDRTELKVGMILRDLDPRHPNRRGRITSVDGDEVFVLWYLTASVGRLSMRTAQERFEVVTE